MLNFWKYASSAHIFYFVIVFGIFILRKKIGSGGLFFKTKDTKKAKTEDKEVSEDGVQAPEKTANSVEKPDDEEGDSEVPSLPLGLTGNFQKILYLSGV